MKNRTLSLILPLVLASSVTSNAALVFNTTGIYDETVNTNVVDRAAGSNPSDLTSYNSFKSFIASEFAAGRGGVINFDSWVLSDGTTDTSTNFKTIDARYGPGLSSSLIITRIGNTGNFTLRSDQYETIGTPISGNTALRSNTYDHKYTFSTALTHIAYTVLSRNASRSITATVTYSDETTDVLTSTIATGTTANDTFFQFTAPEGKSIISLYTTATGNGYFDIDDMAFVVVPEPSVIALGILGTLPLFRRRR